MRFAETNFRLWGYNEPLVSKVSEELKERLSYKDCLKRLVSDIRYTGRGTRTGSALRWSRINFLKKEAGKRLGVKNVFIVITDGKAQDNDLVEAEGKVSRAYFLKYSYLQIFINCPRSFFGAVNNEKECESPIGQRSEQEFPPRTLASAHSLHM